LLNLDWFKNVNAILGHPFGDLVLQRIAELLKTTLRDSDIVCRCRGDEFLMILSNTSVDSAYSLAEKLRLAIKSLEISRAHIQQVKS